MGKDLFEKDGKLYDIFWGSMLGVITAGGVYPLVNSIISKMSISATNKERAVIITEATITVMGICLMYKLLQEAGKSKDIKKYEDSKTKLEKENNYISYNNQIKNK